MASGSNTEHSSISEKYNIMDLSPIGCLTASSDITWHPDTPLPSCLYAPLDSPSNCHCPKNIKPYPMKHWSLDILNRQIETLLQYKLTYHMMRGKPFQTLQHHRQAILQEMGQWLQIPEGYFQQDDCLREDLMTLLASTNKVFKEIPRDVSEWTRLLGHWLKNNVSENVVKERAIYRLLSVDGFFGYEPKHLKLYLSNVFNTARHTYRLHFRAVRILYEWFDEEESVSSLTGTDSGCVVFVALLKLYSVHLGHLLNDDQVKLHVEDAFRRAEGFLNQHRDYYKDIKNVDDKLLARLGQLYQDQFSHEDEWKVVGKELLTK